VSILIATSSLCGAEEWPKWLGPRGDNISTEPIAAAWPADGPKKIWEQPTGYGFASPVALDGRIYLFHQVGDQDTLTAFDAGTGKTYWSQAYACGNNAIRSNNKNPKNDHPVVLATPTVDHGQIYTYGAGGDLVCRKLDTGEQVWHINVINELHEKLLDWAQASTPLVTEKLVYVQCGDGGPTAVAVDRQTGKIVWKSEATTYGGYAAPILVDVNGTQELIVFSGEQLYGMNLHTGKTLWGVPFQNKPRVSAATPIYREGKLFIACDYDRKPGTCMMLEVTPSGAKTLWENGNIAQKFQPGVLDNGFYYVNSEGTLKCMNWSDGKLSWQNNLRLGSGGSVVRDGDKLIVMSERGKLYLVHATPTENKVINQLQLFDYGQVWSSPLIYRGRLYCMGEKSLVCLEVGSSVAMAK